MKLFNATAISSILLSAICITASAQLLANGNSQFPACAADCTLLNQAAQACGGTAAASQQIWSCFCQSAYLTTLYNTPTGICDAFCTNPSDNQQVMTWFKSNCGTDDGASEHGGSEAGATTVVVTSTSTSAAVTVAATTSNGALPTTTSSGGTVEPETHPSSGGTWFQQHYKWVIMLIVLFIGLIVFAALAICLKRRHDRKADQIREGFNAGITSRSAPMSTVDAAGRDGAADTSYASTSQVMTGGLEATSGSGRNSPVRTREAFMPYGYNYTRSESRLGSRTDVAGRKSPLARGETPVRDLEKEIGMGGGANVATPESAAPKRSRRVLVRERSVESPESPEIEKSAR